ncbi:peptidoglycan DD-metalloendopeptidase family protein [Haliangium sp.]|uniref:peptidoglycan DD-metalloendopeptidase family protein n=1 Tax=Haliangium sp. TaxID=2663208 RepID=UPI003D10397E
MLESVTNTLRGALALLLVPTLPLAVAACATGDVDAPEAPAKEVTEDHAASAPSELATPAGMNAAIQEGTRAFTEEHGVEALWELVEPTQVGNIQSVSEDGRKVLFLGATVAADGRMVPDGALWLADLARGEVVSLSEDAGVPLHVGALSPDGARVAAVGGELGHLYVSGGEREPLAVAVENDGASSIAGLVWNQAGDKVAFSISPYVHLEDFRAGDGVGKSLAPEEVPSAKIAWVDVDAGARAIDSVTVAADGLARVSELRWNGDALELAEPEAGDDAGEVVSKGYCAPGSMKRAGNYLGLKFPWESGSSYMVGDDCTHLNRSDQRDFDIDGGSLHNGGPVLSVAAGRVIALNTTVADPDDWTCINSYVSTTANYVVVQHIGAGNTAFTSLYWHLRRNPQVQVSYNQDVNQGTILGYNGCTGYAYGEHLHFGMRDGPGFNYYATEAVPEPIDGYSNLDAGNTYISTNSSSGGGTPPPGQSCSPEGGLWCGGNGVSGDPNILYVCKNGALAVKEVCANGCYRAPAGSPDACYTPNSANLNCTCYSGKYHNGDDIPPSLTYCGMRVCGMDGNVYECRTSNQWEQTGLTCGGGACSCPFGAHLDGTPISTQHTECHFEVCGGGNTWYTCETSGWSAVGGSYCTM